jgi:DNA-binding NarL/FixJ family response regulator
LKILSLDDHPLFSSGLKESLSANKGFKVTSVHQVQDAFIFLKKNADTDLLILDLSMPEMGGISFMNALIARGINTPVVIMSAKEDLQTIQEALDLGSLGYLPKTWSAKQLIEALTKIGKGEIVIPQSIALGLNRISKNAIHNTQTLLSSRQLEILKTMAAGLSNKGVASVLCISESTVKSHLQSVFQILGAKNRIDCIRKAEHLRILPKDR